MTTSSPQAGNKEGSNPTPLKVINVGCSWLNIFSVDTVSQVFEAELLVRLQWLEPVTERVLDHFTELKTADGKSYNVSAQDFKDHCWDPQFTFPNCLDMCNTEQWVRMERSGENISVVWSVRFHSTSFTCIFDLRRFPFDRQHLVVRVSSTWDEKKVQFRSSQTDTISSVIADYNIQDYQLAGTHIVDVTAGGTRYATRSDPGSSTSGVRYNSIFLVQTVQRNPGFYMFNLYLPTFLIASFAFAVFAFVVDDFSGRSSIIVTVLLTVVAFKQGIKQYVPSLPYVTYGDRYILAGLGMVIIIAIETASLAAASLCVSGPQRRPTLCGATVLGSLKYANVDFADAVCWAADVGVWLGYHLVEAILIGRASRRLVGQKALIE